MVETTNHTRSMNCEICNAPASQGLLGLGFYCSDAHKAELLAQQKAQFDELRAESVNEMPEQFETEDFERWTLKFAVHFLDGLSEQNRAFLRKNNPMMLQADQLALEFKDRIICHLHKAYVSETRARGHERMFHGGTYCFRQPVPAEKIVEAARKAQLIN